MDMSYVYGVYLAIPEECSLDICKNTGGPWGHYTQWNETDRNTKGYAEQKKKRERDILIDAKKKKKTNSNRLVVPRVGGREGGKVEGADT